MPKFVTRRPQRSRIEGEARVVAELRRRTAGYGTAKGLAFDTGISLPVIYDVRNNRKQVSRPLGEALGFRLAWVPIEESE